MLGACRRKRHRKGINGLIFMRENVEVEFCIVCYCQNHEAILQILRRFWQKQQIFCIAWCCRIMKRFRKSWGDFDSNIKFFYSVWCCQNHEAILRVMKRFWQPRNLKNAIFFDPITSKLLPKCRDFILII